MKGIVLGSRSSSSMGVFSFSSCRAIVLAWLFASYGSGSRSDVGIVRGSLCHPEGDHVDHGESSTLPRSNATHFVWRGVLSGTFTDASSIQDATDQVEVTSFARSLLKGTDPEGTASNRKSTLNQTECAEVQTYDEAYQECLTFLRDNLMEFDRPFLETLGFPADDETPTADGLGNGLIGPTIELALEAKQRYPWTDALPKEIFQEYVLNYANLNEGRTNWRPLLVDTLRFNESDLWQSGEANLTSVVTWVNQQLWTRLGKPDKPIYFHSGQTPLIFDPMSIIAFGYASCTGTSILFANALRAVGIPARVVGTPAWYGNRTMGNHNWVEVYTGAEADVADQDDLWKFLEPSPANAGLDTLDKKPCERWFCQSSRYPSSRVYAAKLVGPSGDSEATFFPLAWEWHNQDVPGVDRTDYYTEVCKSCK